MADGCLTAIIVQSVDSHITCARELRRFQWATLYVADNRSTHGPLYPFHIAQSRIESIVLTILVNVN